MRGVVEYDGTRFKGFQRLPRQATIQGALEAACSRVIGPTQIAGAGRTDAGAHAAGQVISFAGAWGRGLDELQRAVNALLPPDIVVRELAWAAPGFHARWSAVARWYRYTVHDEPLRSPLRARFVHHVPHAVDHERCDALCAHLVGTRDLAAFGSGCPVNTVRTIHHAACTRRGAMIEIDVVLSSGFSHLVRRLAGTLIRAGRGLIDVDAFLDILDARDPRRAAAPSPACGLCLMEVFY
jgi:tRNA pseudouridine38-40 synthase